MATQVESVRTLSVAQWYPHREPPVMRDWERAVWEFADLVQAIPRVLAVVVRGADQTAFDVQVWTYVKSSDRDDRSLVYHAEAEALLRYPGAFLDFNVELRPEKLTGEDLRGTLFHYRPQNGNTV